MLVVEVGVTQVGVDQPVADQRLGHGSEDTDGEVPAGLGSHRG